jgi:hypothetical protein
MLLSGMDDGWRVSLSQAPTMHSSTPSILACDTPCDLVASNVHETVSAPEEAPSAALDATSPEQTWDEEINNVQTSKSITCVATPAASAQAAQRNVSTLFRSPFNSPQKSAHRTTASLAMEAVGAISLDCVLSSLTEARRSDQQ